MTILQNNTVRLTDFSVYESRSKAFVFFTHFIGLLSENGRIEFNHRSDFNLQEKSGLHLLTGFQHPPLSGSKLIDILYGIAIHPDNRIQVFIRQCGCGIPRRVQDSPPGSLMNRIFLIQLHLVFFLFRHVPGRWFFLFRHIPGSGAFRVPFIPLSPSGDAGEESACGGHAPARPGVVRFFFA